MREGRGPRREWPPSAGGGSLIAAITLLGGGGGLRHAGREDIAIRPGAARAPGQAGGSSS